jgi:plastocyanin
LKLRPVLLLICLFAVLAGDALPQGATGTIKGQVKLTGKLIGNPIIRMGMDPKCSQMNAGKRVVQEFVVAAIDGSLANVFVHLKGNFPQTPVPTQPVVIDQKGCVYGPRVVGARVGQTVQIKNDDELLHNLNAITTKNKSFNVGQPRAGLVYSFQPTAEEVMVHLKCDVHNWMNAYIGVVTNPYYGVTNTMGTFQIDKVPPGTYMIEAWQEKLGVVTKSVTVKPGAVTTVDFSYASTEK